MSELIERKRGDNYPIVATIKTNGTPIDITASVVKFSFKLANGTGVTTEITGSANVDAIGEVSFAPTVLQMSVEGQYVFDIQRDEGGVVATHLSGTMLLQGDVTQ